MIDPDVTTTPPSDTRSDTLEDRPEDAATTAPPSAGGRDRRLLWAVVLPLVIVIAAGGVRFYRLGMPERCYFDETYYYYDARDYLQYGTETSFAVHPPVGKWLIAAGIAVFGVAEGGPVDAAVTVEPDGCIVGEDDPENPAARAREAEEAFARRVMSALFGTGSVAVAYFAGLRLFRRRSAALLGAALLAFDGLALTMSRISMLDIFLQFFVLLGFLAMLVDRDRMWTQTPDSPPRDEDGEPRGELPEPSRRWLWLTGVFMGLALATKLSALAPLGLTVIWVLGSELWWRRRWTGRWTPDLARAVARGFLALAMVPIAIYLVSYAGWFANFEDTRKADRCTVVPETTPDSVQTTAEDLADVPALPQGSIAEGCQGLEVVEQIAAGWWEEQGEILRFHRDLEAEHPYRAPATTWPLMTRPVAYYYESCAPDRADPDVPCEVAEGNVAEVLGMGNPAIWWSALVGYPFLLWFAFRQRAWPAMTIALFLFGQALPYLASPRPVFLFYLTPVVPFIALTLAYLVDESLDSETMRWVPALVTILALVGFAFWAPIFLGTEIPRQLWDTLILFPGWV